jgi:hypothetical protein
MCQTGAEASRFHLNNRLESLGLFEGDTLKTDDLRAEISLMIRTFIQTYPEVIAG